MSKYFNINFLITCGSIPFTVLKFINPRCDNLKPIDKEKYKVINCGNWNILTENKNTPNK